MPRGHPKKKPKPKPAAFGPLPATMSDAKEIALALCLWKSLRCHALLKHGDGDGEGFPSAGSSDAGERALRLANKLGVKTEFLDLLFELDLYRIEIKAME